MSRFIIPFAKGFPRTYAQAAATNATSTNNVTNKILLTLASPSKTILKKAPIDSIGMQSSTGDLSMNPRDFASVYQLRPSVLKIVADGKTTKYFVSGGYAVMNEDSTLNVTVMDAITLENLDAKAIETNLAASEQKLKSAKDDVEKAVAEIEIDVNKSMLLALK